MLSQLVFNSGRQYLDDKSKKDVKDFCEVWPERKCWYKKGTMKLQVYKHEFPIGAITPETEFVGEDERDGTRFYVTPNAILRDSKTVKIWVRWEDEKSSEEGTKIMTGSGLASFLRGATMEGVKDGDPEAKKKAKDRLARLKTIEKTAGPAGSVEFARDTMEKVKAENE